MFRWVAFVSVIGAYAQQGSSVASNITVDASGNMHINSAPGQTIYLNGLDVSTLTNISARLMALEQSIVGESLQSTLTINNALTAVSPSSAHAFTAAGIYRVVPSTTLQVQFQVWGAGGGSGTFSSSDLNGRGRPSGMTQTSNVGGGGGYTSCTLTLNAGTTYTVIVGSGGVQTQAGENGGPILQGSGGGYSGVFATAATPTQATALLVAGGGGGGGYGDWSRPGGGGGASGQDASYNSHLGTGAPSSGAGQGGSASAGGTSGTNTGGGTGNPGAAGSALEGGRSAGVSVTDAAACTGTFGGGGCTWDCGGGSYDGGGGGGGYWGGGGGSCHWSGSGGGGSGYISSGRCSASSMAQANYEVPAEAANPSRAAHGATAGEAGNDGLVVLTMT